MKTKLLAMCIIALLTITYSNNTYAQRDAGGSSGGDPIDPATGMPYAPEASAPDQSAPCITQPPPESFKRNNGDGTCGKDGQIRLKFISSPSAAPVLIALRHMDGSPVTNITLPIEGDASELAKKKYASYCIEGANIKPAKKLVAVFRIPGSCQGDITLSEN